MALQCSLRRLTPGGRLECPCRVEWIQGWYTHPDGEKQYMKVAILAGGFGSRLVEETRDKPKAMVEIGGRPILWHIMMHYDRYGFKDFCLALGYRGEHIREYVRGQQAGPSSHAAASTEGRAGVGRQCKPDWTINLVDTGLTTESGGRIKRLGPHVGDETFMLTWCDGLSDVNLRDLLAFHRAHGKLATLTAVHPPSRFGHLDLDSDRVVRFSEKPFLTDRWINGAFFVLEPAVLDYIEGRDTQWEKEPLERLAREGQLMAYRHSSFWQCMDTIRERESLEALWQRGEAPWKTWE
jgi:glucose-1-phosphate cytidylyltransferase